MPRLCQFFAGFLLISHSALATEPVLESASDNIVAQQIDPIPLFSMTDEAIRFVMEVTIDCKDPAAESALTMMIADTFLARTINTLDQRSHELAIDVPPAQLEGLQAETLCRRSGKVDRLRLNDAFSVQIGVNCADAPRGSGLMSLPLSVDINCEVVNPEQEPPGAEQTEIAPTSANAN
ncbi:MAG: hypothetical protein AB8F65_04995 [Woeseiaceae bacterium]